ncbi:MAG: hypothetical protein E6H04_10940, partial [Bacillati bacterium ANGP1]
MPYRDLREYLTVLEEAGKLHHIRTEVDKTWEIAAVSRLAFQEIPEERRPALMFDRVQGHDIPVCVGVLGASRWVYALALETEPEGIPDAWARAQRVKRGEAATLLELPTPIWTRGHDPGPYLTAPCVITRDPDTGIVNVGTYRCQIKGARKIGMWVNFLQHARQHVEPRRLAGERVPVAIVLGPDPSVSLCSVTRIVYGVDELAVAGGLRGTPLDVVSCVTSDLAVPATAEIVIEGEILPDLEEEGPFGEYPGYMGAKADSYVVEVQAITCSAAFPARSRLASVVLPWSTPNRTRPGATATAHVIAVCPHPSASTVTSTTGSPARGSRWRPWSWTTTSTCATPSSSTGRSRGGSSPTRISRSFPIPRRSAWIPRRRPRTSPNSIRRGGCRASSGSTPRRSTPIPRPRCRRPR